MNFFNRLFEKFLEKDLKKIEKEGKSQLHTIEKREKILNKIFPFLVIIFIIIVVFLMCYFLFWPQRQKIIDIYFT